MRPSYFIGFDPGGSQAFGWAVLSEENAELTLSAAGTCSDAREALKMAKLACPSAPKAIAVDAPLFWVQVGDRNSDKVVRKLVCASGGSGGTVGHVNSLRGACLVQGILVARLAVEAWPLAKVSEAHPKALLAVSSNTREFATTVAASAKTEHERDAALAAFTAYKFATASDGWHDLAACEKSPHNPVGSPVSYWFPKTQA